MTEKILSYLAKCPALENIYLSVDYLGREIYSGSLDGVGKTKTIRTYTDGDSLKKRTYTLYLRLPYGIDKLQNLENIRRLDELTMWLSENSKIGVLPELSETEMPISVSGQAKSEPERTAAGSAVFAVDIEVLYYSTKKNERM